MKVAVIGTGIAGNVIAHLLAPSHDLTVFEANDYVGGHTNTVRVDAEDGPHDVDTGFIVFNEERYPLFVSLLARLGVASNASVMSFGVRSERTGLEYSNRALFAQRRNLLRPSFHRMLAEIVRFNRATPRLIEGSDEETLGNFLERERYGREFIDEFLFPMGAAIWSSDPAQMREFPARFFARFFAQHRFLDVFGQPEWRVVRGGSARYVEALTRGHRERIRLESPVTSVARRTDHVGVTARGAEPESFDQVVIATHADEALAMLGEPTDAERETLGSFRFQENVATLHTDTGLMPKRRAAWAAWNATIPKRAKDRVSVTYDMNILQGIRSRNEYLVTLNGEDDIRPERKLRTISYRHPVYSRAAVRAQKRHGEISGADRIHFCGAYWGFGFHEDGVASALSVAARFGKGL